MHVRFYSVRRKSKTAAETSPHSCQFGKSLFIFFNDFPLRAANENLFGRFETVSFAMRLAFAARVTFFFFNSKSCVVETNWSEVFQFVRSLHVSSNSPSIQTAILLKTEICSQKLRLISLIWPPPWKQNEMWAARRKRISSPKLSSFKATEEVFIYGAETGKHWRKCGGVFQIGATAED